MMETATTKRYVRAPEQAKMLRGALKAEFPGVKFSVRCSRGSAIDVSWVDGPRTSRVQAVCDRYRGGGFDGMQDLRYSVETFLPTEDGGEVVQFSADFVFAHRTISDEWRNEILDLFEETIGRKLEGDREDNRFPWHQQVPLSVQLFGDDAGELLHMVEHCTEDLSSVYHQYQGARDRS